MAEKKQNRGYLTGREIRAIAKANAKEIQRLEAYKNRKCDESEFLTTMKNPDNSLEIEDLHTYFYTEQGVVRRSTAYPTTCPSTLWWASWASPAAASRSPVCR